MRILLPTGAITADIVREAAAGYPADVVVTGEIASFLSPRHLTELLRGSSYDLVIVSGMSTASFSDVEEETGVPVFRGPRHAADLRLVLPLIGTVTLSRTIPADDFLADKRKTEAGLTLKGKEAAAGWEYFIRGVKIGGGSRIKVLAEIMDAHRCAGLRDEVERFFESGADIVDLGFGFDATPADVRRCFQDLHDIPGPLAVDTQDPALILAALDRADLVLSLHDGNIPSVGEAVARAGVAVVVVPSGCTLGENCTRAREAGISCIIADPLIQPVGSGFTGSIRPDETGGYPLFFGAGNVAELLDADSIGVNALLAGIACELGASIIFISEHSDKTRGSVREMRTATEMMVLAEGRPYPKDLGIDLLILKEKRRRREPPLSYREAIDAPEAPREIVYDPCGNFRIGIADGLIIAVIGERAYRGLRWVDVFSAIQQNGDVSLLDHAAYLGRELYKAELAIRFGRSFEQDGDF
ncbi:MAG: dihydropteroate synthase-like protein [Methanoregulaceae archaeon]|nr:dihydropteroate synthase-like protein [Methanoregulaceae archaeon]